MNYNKTSKLLKKFKGLHNTLRDSGQEPSGIEKDLLLSYLKELYENVMSIEAESATPTLPSDPVDEVITASSNGHSQQYVPQVQTTKPAPEVVVPAEQAPVAERVAASAPPVAAQAPPVQVTPPAPVVQQEIAPPVPNSPLSELFADKGVNELSDKLNKLPISDINRAMGINEKVLTINELFHGDQELFSKTMLKLNSFNSFNEAKSYLIRGVASDLSWAGEGKVKKADKFIQLLRRRYS